jgi:hypothetical protein
MNSSDGHGRTAGKEQETTNLSLLLPCRIPRWLPTKRSKTCKESDVNTALSSREEVTDRSPPIPRETTGSSSDGTLP